CRRTVDRRDDHRPPRAEVELDTDPDELALGRLVEQLRLFGIEERRVTGVAQRIDHAATGAVDERLVVDRAGVDVVLVNRVPGLDQRLELRQVLERRRRPRVASPLPGKAIDGDAAAKDDDHHQGQRRPADLRHGARFGCRRWLESGSRKHSMFSSATGAPAIRRWRPAMWSESGRRLEAAHRQVYACRRGAVAWIAARSYQEER